jgi:hypothetical protein
MFLSSHYNSPGWVVLWLFPHLTSTAMKRWRSERNRDGGGLVAGAGNRQHLPRNEWNLAQPGEEADALEVIRAVVVPWFQLFDDHGCLVDELCRRDVPAMSPEATVEYLLCFEGREAAARSVDGYLNRHPEHAPVFWAWIHRFRREGGGTREALQDVRNLASLVVSEELALISLEGRDSPELARDPGAQRSRVIAMQADIADDLRNYGEDEVASKVMRLRRDQLERLFELAAVHAQTGMLFAKALALAAVEVVEGHTRALRRGRRKFS